jgi:hypothetical protein
MALDVGATIGSAFAGSLSPLEAQSKAKIQVFVDNAGTISIAPTPFSQVEFACTRHIFMSAICPRRCCVRY